LASKRGFIKPILFLFFIFPCTFVFSQTLEGTTGLYFIPTAEMEEDGTLIVGANFVYKDLISFGSYQTDAFTPYITFTYLPFVELNLKITRPSYSLEILNLLAIICSS
jgi:hypothetical protein